MKAIESFRMMKDRPFGFFLDSSLVDGKLGRWSFLGSDPFLVFKSKRDRISLAWKDGRREEFRANPFAALSGIFSKFASPERSDGVPFKSGGVGYFAYDLKDFVEDLPDIARDDLDLPDCIMGFYDSVTAVDNMKEETPAVPVSPRKGASYSIGEIRSNFTRDSYIKTVERAKRYIKRGDIYQVNLSQRFEAGFEGDPFELYRNLRELSPAPFSSYLNFGDCIVMSSSPERFLKVEGDYVETRPVKGTRPRGSTAEEDARLEEELRSSPKDRAEHVMIVDLERNDLGRICEYGTVSPEEFVILETYAKVFHLVSTVSGRLRKGVTPVDCLRATFPGGSITGAPKIRSMEIIEELEPVKRSVYTGAIGYMDFRGSMDTSITIRTFVLKGDRIYFQVGGGIVADSDPGEEYQETLDKAHALRDILSLEREPIFS